jgi:hypothetical protein
LDISADDFFGLSPDIGAVESNYFTIETHTPEGTGFSTSPNPSESIFHLSFDNYQNTRYEIFNAKGELIKVESLKNKETKIDLSGFPNGTYFINVSGKKFETTKKIILSK